VYWDLEDIRTPSAPPIMESGQEDSISLEIEKDIQKIEDEICGEAGVESSKQESMRSSSHLYRVEEFGERYFPNLTRFFVISFCGLVLMCLIMVWCSVKDSKTVEDSKISEICSDELEECHSIRFSTYFISEVIMKELNFIMVSYKMFLMTVVNMLGKVFWHMMLV